MADQKNQIESLRIQAVRMYQANRFLEASRLNYNICQLDPGNADAWYALAWICLKIFNSHDAEIAARKAISIAPKRPESYTVLGGALQQQHRYGDALAVYKQALKLKKKNPGVHHNIGQLFKQMGNTKEALQSYRQAQKILAQEGTHSNILMCLNYFDRINPEELYQEHIRWGKRYGDQNVGRHKFANTPNAERQLRIGYVSADFREHPVAWFLEPVLAHHDKNMFHITCYSAVAIPDHTTARLSRLVEEWRNIYNKPDGQVVQQVKNDKIDILVDLSGHTAGNRLKVFAQKPAPVQVTYLGYPNTTGVDTVDYRLTDTWADPPEMTEPYHCEKLVRLPHGFLCYSPHPDASEVSPSPFIKNGYITFGSFNSLAKIMPPVVAAWAAILKKLPEARLFIKTYSFTDPDTRESYMAQFNDAGVDAERIELRGPVKTMSDHLGMYREVDIALDTFPYNGTTTTLEALWMGVPTITAAGKSHAGRVGVSLLAQAGLDEFIAESIDEYISIAVHLAENTATVQQLRNTLRDRVSNSTLCDARSFTHYLEEAYRNMWRDWCQVLST